MKGILLFAVILLAACSKQEEQQVIKSHLEQNDEVFQALDHVKQQQIKSGSYNETDPAVKLDIIEFAAVIRSLYPNYPAYFSEKERMFQTTKSIDAEIKPFERFEDWSSIKIFHNKGNKYTSHVIVEVYDPVSYAQSKKETFDVCKNIWKGIDQRVSNKIEELVERLEKKDSKATTSYIHSGYRYILDASHYSDGYPVSCIVGYDNITND
ncbi:hypothetical protein [Acinetobacter indicus]|uniref:hypothetical protein n=1 Tax=Acinetobacter indicus TaxID=756892 RepID=UPI0032B39577